MRITSNAVDRSAGSPAPSSGDTGIGRTTDALAPITRAALGNHALRRRCHPEPSVSARRIVTASEAGREADGEPPAAVVVPGAAR
jgi:hypothetical protein